MANHDDGSPVKLIYVPLPMVERVIQYFYDGPMVAHEGAKKVSARIAGQDIWSYMKQNVTIYVAACSVCSKFRRVTPSSRAEL